MAGTQVPDLIERYRVRRDAWIAQADELARLRDEVRGAAEREAMEIVTGARRDVRQVIMEARRELLVLSAQVQAALGEVAGKPDPAALLRAHAASSTAAAGLPPSSTDHSGDILVPEAAVKTMLDEARADMEALAHDAKTVPFQSTTAAAQFPSEHPPIPPRPLTSFEAPAPAAFESGQPKVLFETLPPHTFEVAAADSIESHEIRPHQTKESRERSFGSSVEFESISSLQSGSPAASRVLLSSPFPSDSVPVPPGRSVRAFVALFVAVGLVVLGGSVWWVKAHNSSTTSEPPSLSAASPNPVAGAPAPSIASASTSAPVLAAKETAAPLSLAVEARRQSWIRTTVDGESDPGRTYAAGEKLLLNARHGISLRVGDAGAVYVSVNKGATTPLGQNGQVMTKQFVAEAGSPSDNGAPVAAELVPAAPKPVAPPASVPTASNTPTAPVPVPLVQPAPPQQNAAALAGIPALGRRDPAPAPSPRTESATVGASQPTVPAVAATAAPSPPAPTVPPPASNASPASAVVAAARQWLDAYHRQERSTMAALSTENLQLADERRAEERFPATADVNRSLDRVSVQIAADTAVLTAVMTERGDTGERVSPISQVWIFSGGQWRVKQVRLVSEARLNQIFR